MIGGALVSILLAGVGVGIRWDSSFAEAQKKARAQQKPLLVDFWAEWCGWCHRLDKTTYVDPTVTRLAQDFVAVKVNTEGSPQDVEVAVRYDVTSLPTILFVTPDGHQIHRVNGFQGPGKFPRSLERAREMAVKVMGWETALQKDPKDAAALAGLGTHLFEQEFFEEARDLLMQATKADASDVPATRRQTRMLLAIIQNYDHRYQEAESLLKDGLAMKPAGDDEPKLLFILGRTYMKWGRAPEARKIMNQIVMSHGRSPMAQKAREQLALLASK